MGLACFYSNKQASHSYHSFFIGPVDDRWVGGWIDGQVGEWIDGQVGEWVDKIGGWKEEGVR